MKTYDPSDFDRFSTYKKSDLFPKYRKPLSAEDRERLGIVKIEGDLITFWPGVFPMRERLIDATDKENFGAAAGQSDIDLDGGEDRTGDLPTALKKRLNTIGGGKHNDESREDSSIITAMLAAGRSPQDVLETFLASPRGEDAATRHDMQDYLPRTIRKAQAFLDANPAPESVEIVSDSADEHKPERFRSWTLKELFESNDPPLEYLAWPLVARGLVTLLDGLPKLGGKTTLTLFMLQDCFLRHSFLGRETKQVVVVYVTEEHRTTFKAALNKLHMTPQRLPKVQFHIITRNEWMGLPWPDLLAKISALCERVGANLLVVDTLYRILGLKGEEINQSGRGDEAIGNLAELAARLNLGVLVARHERKSGGEISVSGLGTIAASGAADIVAVIRRHRSKGPVRELEVLGRGTSNGVWLIKPTKEDDGHWRYTLTESPKEVNPKDKKDELVDQIATILRTEAKPMSQNQICKKIKRRKSYVVPVLEARDGELWKSQAGPRGSVLYAPISKQ
jgi:hypothetical protein